MGYRMDFRSDRENRSLASFINEESERLCRIIDTSGSSERREQALSELKELAATVQLVIAALEAEEFEPSGATGYKAAA